MCVARALNYLSGGLETLLSLRIWPLSTEDTVILFGIREAKIKGKSIVV